METKFDAETHDPLTLSASTPSSNVSKDPIAHPSPPWHLLLMTLTPFVVKTGFLAMIMAALEASKDLTICEEQLAICGLPSH
jgi:hypothetical protein